MVVTLQPGALAYNRFSRFLLGNPNSQYPQFFLKGAHKFLKMLNTTAFTILLIREVLYNLKLIKGLGRAGIDASIYLSDFSALILEITGFTEHKTSDELYTWYTNCQNKLVENIDPKDAKEFRERAFDFYIDLMVKKCELGLIEHSNEVS